MIFSLIFPAKKMNNLWKNKYLLFFKFRLDEKNPDLAMGRRDSIIVCILVLELFEFQYGIV